MRKDVDSDFYLLLGKVECTDFSEQTTKVVISFEIFSRPEKCKKIVSSSIYFEDQKTRADDKPLIPWASIARNTRLIHGDIVLVVVRFPGYDFSEGYGYGIKRCGVIWFGTKNAIGKFDRYAIGGKVCHMQDNIDRLGSKRLMISVNLGINYLGAEETAIIEVINEALANRCRNELRKPKFGFPFAWFCCDTPKTYTDKKGFRHSVYTAFQAIKVGIVRE